MAKRKFDTRVLALAAFIVLVIGGGIATFTYLAGSSKYVSIDKSLVQAPVVSLTPAPPGTLKQVYVAVGDTVPPNAVVAAVGTELIKASAGGLVVEVNNDIGKVVAPQDTIV